MLLTIDNEHKEHLAFLVTVTPEIIREFGRIAVNLLKKGVNTKIYNSAAQKLDVTVDVIRQGVEGLTYLFIESAKCNLSDDDFKQSLLLIGFGSELIDELAVFYLDNKSDLRRVLDHLTTSEQHYHNLEWRFDVEVASRSLRNQVDPVILMKLVLSRGGQKETSLLQTDPVNLVHMTEVLDQALQEMKTQHCRRISRLVK